MTNSTYSKINITHADITDGSFVTIDTIKPVITVIDASNNTVLQGATYQDPGTVITDANNTSYDGTATATQLDTSILGAQNITYTGPADAAGNIPDPVNRTITVLPKPLGIAPGLDLAPVIGITDGTKYPTLSGAYSITTTTIEGSTYALVAAKSDNGVQIINIDDPYHPTNVSSITDGTQYPELDGPRSITITTIENFTYALVASVGGGDGNHGGVQIINITDPYNPINASSITHSTRYPELHYAHSITTTTIEGSTYALVAAYIDAGVQIINIDDPYNPTNASSITDGTQYPTLNGAASITTTTIGGSTYALVAALHDDGIQIINIDDPYNPTNVSSITDGTSYPTLDGPRSITITTIENSIYALVAASNSNGIQTINITDPYNPTNVSYVVKSERYPTLDDAFSITTTTIEGSTYALVASDGHPGGVQIIRLYSPLLSIFTNNTHPLYAKTGDSLSIEFTVNNTFASSNASILEPGLNATSIIGGRDLNYTIIVPPTQREEYANFAIQVTDTIGENLSITEDDLPFNIFIDTISPRIRLDGPAEYFIIHGTVDPIISNVTVTDGDPKYSGGFTLDTNGTVNATINGSVYNYTYTADADNAGNLGESVSRIITIIDADPINVTSLNITSSSGNNFANTGKTITVTLVTDSTDLGNFTGTLLGRDIAKENANSGTVTFTATVFSNDTNENATFSITATNSSGNKILVTNYDITDASFVIIDTVKPIIILNGNSDDTVLQGNNYVDLGANVSDPNNSLYTQTIIALPTNLDTSSLGEQNITYSAPPDAAGNVPDSINRTVTVQAKPLGLETLTIESNNTKNNMYAKIGDKITITLVANGTIGSATSTIASNTITPVLTGSTLVASYIVDSSVSDTNSLAFTINASNEDGLKTVIFTEANLPNSSIIIDNTAPTITLNGNNNTIVPANNSYTDPGATASDLSYASDITVTGTSNIDTTQPGNYTFTYTALDDEAPGSVVRVVCRHNGIVVAV